MLFKKSGDGAQVLGGLFTFHCAGTCESPISHIRLCETRVAQSGDNRVHIVHRATRGNSGGNQPIDPTRATLAAFARSRRFRYCVRYNTTNRVVCICRTACSNCEKVQFLRFHWQRQQQRGCCGQSRCAKVFIHQFPPRKHIGSLPDSGLV